jgi:hypothetical protein
MLNKNFYYQQDAEWKDLVMVFASEMWEKIDKTDDTIGEFGCNMITELNIFNSLFPLKKMNPDTFNAFCRITKVYNALYGKCKDSVASYFRDYDFWKLFDCTYLEVDKSNWYKLENTKKTKYKITLKDTNSPSGKHIVNFLKVLDKDQIYIYNVYNNKEENVSFKKIHSIKQITKK